MFDAVVILCSSDGAKLLSTLPAARDFIADARSHRKFIAYSEDALPLLEKTVGPDSIDEGFMLLKLAKDTDSFIAICRKLRFWERANAER